jgi:hypothetical protein
VHLPKAFVMFGRTARLLLQIPRKLRLTEQLFYDLRTEKWQYYPDVLARLRGKKKPHSFA